MKPMTNEQEAIQLVEEMKERRNDFFYEGTSIKLVKFTNAKNNSLHSLTAEVCGSLKPLMPRIFDLYEGKSLEEHVEIWKKRTDYVTLLK